MFKYEIVIYWSNEDKCFMATVPKLAGCMADGETQEEVLENIQVVVFEWIETAKLLGRDILESKGNSVYA